MSRHTIRIPADVGVGAEVSHITYDQQYSASREAWSLRPPNGPSITVSWNHEDGQWYVSILTEEGAVAADANGHPYLDVEVNDVPIYDNSTTRRDDHIAGSLAWRRMNVALSAIANNQDITQALNVCGLGFELQEKIKNGEQI